MIPDNFRKIHESTRSWTNHIYTPNLWGVTNEEVCSIVTIPCCNWALELEKETLVVDLGTRTWSDQNKWLAVELIFAIPFVNTSYRTEQIAKEGETGRNTPSEKRNAELFEQNTCILICTVNHEDRNSLKELKNGSEIEIPPAYKFLCCDKLGRIWKEDQRFINNEEEDQEGPVWKIWRRRLRKHWIIWRMRDLFQHLL